MPNFEVIPGNPRKNVEHSLEKIAMELGYTLNILEETEEKIRFQILTEDSVGTGKVEHEAYFAALLQNSEYLNSNNTSLSQHPMGSWNISINCLNLSV